MVRGACWISLIILVVSIGWPCGANDNVRVIVLPFEVNTMEDLGYLEKEIPKNLGRELESYFLRLVY